MQAYGEGGLRADGMGSIDHLARLSWYKVELVLMRHGDDLRLYGAGIVSSFGESVFALEDASPNRNGFDLKRLMRTQYRIHDYQQSYFVIDSFEDLLRKTSDVDFGPIYRELEPAREVAPDDVVAADALSPQ